MRNRAVALAGLFGAAIVCGALFTGMARAADDKTYTIAPKYTVGEIVKYKMKSNMTMEMTAENGQSPFPGGDMVMNMGMKYKTTKVDDAGTATVVISVSGGEMSFMGQTLQMPATPPMTVEMDKRGISKSVKGLEKTENFAAMSQMFDFSKMPSSGFFYPDKPVKVGDSWDAELPGIGGKKTMKVESKLISVDMVDGKEVFKVKQTWKMPMEMMIGPAGPTTKAEEAMMVMGGEFLSVGDVLLASDTGRITKLSSDVKGAMTMEMKGEAAQQAPFGKMNIKLDGKAVMDLASVGTVDDEPEPLKPATPTAKPAAKPVVKTAPKKPAAPVKKP